VNGRPARGVGPRRALGAHHPKVGLLRALLRDPRRRRAERAVVLEGARLIAGALDRGAAIRGLYLAAGAPEPLDGLEARAAAAGAEIFEVPAAVLERVATTVTPQPVLGEFTGPAGPAEPWPPPADGGGPAVLVLAGVSDPGNVGTLIRSAEAAGVRAVVRGPGTADATNPKALRASAGAVFGPAIVDVPAVAAALEGLRRAGWVVVGTTPYGGRPIDDAALDGAVVVVVGSEAHGLDADLDALLDQRVSIPMAAGESLNAAVAGSVVLFEAARRRRLATAPPRVPSGPATGSPSGGRPALPPSGARVDL